MWDHLVKVVCLCDKIKREKQTLQLDFFCGVNKGHNEDIARPGEP